MHFTITNNVETIILTVNNHLLLPPYRHQAHSVSAPSRVYNNNHYNGKNMSSINNHMKSTLCHLLPKTEFLVLHHHHAN